jgi:uncharacterized protein YukJ
VTTSLGTLGTTVPSTQAGLSYAFQTVLLNGVVGHPEVDPLSATSLAVTPAATYAAASEWDYSFQITSGNAEQNSHDWMLLLNNAGSYGHTLYGIQVNVTTNAGTDQETWPDGDDYRPEYPENAPQHKEGDPSLAGGSNVTQYFEVTNPNLYVNFEMALVVAPDPYWYGSHYGSNTTAATAQNLGTLSATPKTTSDVFETLYDRSLVTTGSPAPSVNINVSSPLVQIQQHFYTFTVAANGNVTISQSGLASGDMVLSGGSLSGFLTVQNGQAIHLNTGTYVIETVDQLTTLSAGQSVVALRPPGEDFQTYSLSITYAADKSGTVGNPTNVSKNNFNGGATSDALLQSGGTVVDWIIQNGLYSSGNVLTTGATGYSVVGTGDFNRDGTSDILLQDDSTVVDWIIKNGQYQSGNVLTTAATGYTVVGTGDFNGDGTSDVLLQNGGTVVDWIMQNGLYQSGNVLTTAATGYTVVGTGDFNGDGTSDVLLQSGGTVVDWIMKNGAYQSGNVLTTGATGYTVVGTGDFNGDGTSDVLLQNGGTVVDWIMKNGAYQSGYVLTTAATGFTVVGTGDYNGDGTSDVLLQNGGTVVDWIMKNGAYQSGNVITTAATGFTVSP